jgi:lipopolysaccharide export system permease protein
VSLVAAPRAWRSTALAWRFPSYLLREFVPLFLIFMPVLLVMMTIDHLSYTAGFVINNGASISLLFQSWIERFPFMISYITPPSLAITILIGLGRLAKDSELKAAYSAGVPPLRLVWPILLFAIPVTLGMFLNTNYVQPITEARVLETYNTLRGQPGGPRRQAIQSFVSPDGRTIYHAGMLTPREGDPNTADLVGVMVVTDDGTWTSESGTWDAKAKTWELTNVSYTDAPLDPDLRDPDLRDPDLRDPDLRDSGLLEPIRSGQLPLEPPISSPTPDSSTPASSTPASPQLRRVFEFVAALSPDVRPPEHLSLPELIARARLETQTVLERYQAKYRLQTRFADPFACLVFALVATSVGLTVADRGGAFAAVIVFIAGYFMIWTPGKGLAGSQAVPYWVAAWLPALVFGTGSLLSLRRLV